MICEVIILNPANKATIIRILLVPVFIFCFYLPQIFPGVPVSAAYIISAGVFFIACMTDFWDGWYARKHNLVSNFGKLMDPMADKLLYATVFILLCANGDLLPILTVIFIGRELVICCFRLIAAEQGIVIAAGIIGKAKTVVQFFTILLLLLNHPLSGILTIPAQILSWLSAVVSVWSCLDYILKNKAVLADVEK